MNIRKLLTFLLLFVSYISFGQIVKGTGITYTNGVPTHVPRLGFDSEININMTTGKVYRWQRPTNTWFQIADGIDIWNGSGIPNYTPQYVQSPFAINLQRRVYYYKSGTWYCLNCASDNIVAKNGLTRTVDTIYLGGYLDRTTEIDGLGVYPFRLDSLGLFYTAVNSTGGTAIQTMSLIPNTSAGINVTSTNKSTPTTNTNLNIRPGNPSQLKSTDGSQSAYYRLSPDSIIIGQGIAGGYLTTNKKIVITQDSLIFTNIDQTPYNYPVLVVSNDGTVYKDTSFISKILQDSSLINKIDTFEIVGNQLRISLLDDGEPYKQVSLLPYLDNTDTSGYNIALTFSNDTLSIQDGQGVLSVDLSSLNTVDTSGYNQAFVISNDTLYITDDNSTLFVDLSNYMDNTDTSGYNITFYRSNDTLYIQDGNSTLFTTIQLDTDDQTLSLSNDTLYIENGNFVLLDSYLDNTDTSGYNLAFYIQSDTLYVQDGDSTLSVSLLPYKDNTDTSGYNLSFVLINDTLSVTDGNSTLFVNLSQYLDNTDTSGYNISLSLSNDTLYVEDANSILFIDLSSINTDNQTIDTFQLVGNTLQLSISGDNEPYKSVDLSSIVPTLIAGPGISISGDTITNIGDLSITNEGILGVIPNTVNDARIISNTQGAIGVVISGGTGILVNPLVSSLDSGEIRIASNASLNVLNGTDSTSIVEINTDVGLGIVFLEQDNITLTEAAGILNGDTIKISANVPVDTFALNGNKIVLSLLHDNVPADTLDLTPALDGNGIYGGSGYVPFGTVATIGKTFTFLSTDTTGLEVPFRVEVSGNEPDIQVWSTGADSLLLHQSDQEFEFFSNQDIIFRSDLDLHFISDSLDISNLPTALASDTFVVIYGANNVLKKKSINQVGGNDGNGIYSGSGNVPAYTNPQLEGSINFQSLIDTSKFQVSLGNLYSSNLTVKPDSISLSATNVGGTSSVFISPSNIRLNTPTSGQIDITGNAMIYGANYSPFADREIPDYAAVKSIVADSSYQISAGTGISISGVQTKVITNTGDLSTTNEIQTLSFTTPNLSISSGNSVSLSTLIPTALQIPNTRIVYGTGTSVGSTYNMTYNPSSNQVLRISGLNTQGGILLDSLGASQPGLYIKNSNSDANTFYGLKVERTAGNAASAIRVENTAGSGTNPDARLELFVNSGGSNDPEIIFYTGVEDYVIGIDNSVTGDVFKITPSSPMNAYDGITMLSDGSIGIETAPVTSIPFTTTTARITTLQTSGGSSGSSGQVLTSGGAGAFTWSTLVDNSITNEIQQIDTFAIVGNILRLSLSSDGVPFKTVDLGSFSGGSTDLSFSGTSSPVTLNSSTGTDVTITSGGINTLSATGSNITITATEVDGSVTNEIQTIDTFQIVSNTLRLGLSGNTQPFQTVDLSTYLDNTDAQSLTFTGASSPYTLDISGGSDVTFNSSGIVTLNRSSNELTIGATEVDGSITNEIQTIDTLSLTGSTLGVSLSGNSQPTQTVSLAPLLSGYPSGSGTTNNVIKFTSSSTIGNAGARFGGDTLIVYRNSSGINRFNGIGMWYDPATGPRVDAIGINSLGIYINGTKAQTFTNTAISYFLNPTFRGSSTPAFTLHDDVNNIYWQVLNSSGPLIFRSYYSGGGYYERLRIKKEGDVGIGTNGDPSARLHIVGSGATSSTYTFIITNSSGTTTTAPLVVRDDNVVGIGTNSPAQTLHVAGTQRLTGSSGTPTNVMGRDANGDIANLTLGSGLSLSGGSLTATGTPGGSSGQVQYNSSGSFAGSSAFVWDNVSSRLGIGASPTIGSVNVVSNSGPYVERAFVATNPDITSTTQVRSMYFGVGAGFQSGLGNGTLSILTGNNTTRNIFDVDASSNPVQVIWTASQFIRNNAVIKYGSTAAEGNLTIPVFNFNTSNNLEVGPKYGGNKPYGIDFYIDYTTANYKWLIASSGAELMRLTGTGSLGIGSNNPSSRLHVVGSGATSATHSLLVTNSTPTTILAVRDDSKVGVLTSAPAQTFHVEGTARITGSTGTSTSIMGRDANGDISAITVGSGLSLSGNSLTASASGPAGQNSNIQFYKDGSFGADHLFTYDTIYNRIAVGVSTATATGTFRGNASISRVLLTENQSGTDIVTVLREGYLKFGNQETYPRIFPANILGNVDLTRTGLIYDTRLSSTYNLIGNYFKITFDSLSTASYYGIALDPSFAPVATNSAWTAMYIGSTINQTGGSSGITRGIQIAPLLTSAYDYRALEISNTSGKAIYQTSTGPTNILAGNTSIGSTNAPTSTLDVSGSLELGYVEKTSTYTATSADFTINCTSGTFTVYLPTAVGITGRIYVIKNSGVGTITVDGNGTETIDGGEIMDITSYYQLIVQSTGSNWIILSYF